jgi:hypothetical protein
MFTPWRVNELEPQSEWLALRFERTRLAYSIITDPHIPSYAAGTHWRFSTPPGVIDSVAGPASVFEIPREKRRNLGKKLDMEAVPHSMGAGGPSLLLCAPDATAQSFPQCPQP